MYIKKISFLRLICKISIILLLLLAAITMVCVFALSISIFGSENPFLIAIFTLVVELIGCFIFKKKLRNVYNRLAKKLYSALLKIKNPNLKNCLITTFNDDDIKCFDKQSQIINTVLDLIDREASEIIWIEGISESGKTSSVYMLFDLVGKRNSLKEQRAFLSLDGRSVYIDCTLAQQEIAVFLEDYNQDKFLNNYIFIDNITNLSEELQKEFYNNIIKPYTSGNDIRAKLVILFLNKENWYALDNEFNIEKAEIKRFNLEYELNSYLNALNIERSNYNISEDDWDMLKLWLCKIKKHITCNKEIEKLLAGRFDCIREEALFCTFIIACRYVNSFSKREVRRVFKTIIPMKRSEFNKVFQKFYKRRIIVRFPFLSKHYSLNTKTTKYFRKLFCNQSIYQKIQVAYDESIKKKNNTVLRWLSYIDMNISNLKSYDRNLFDMAFAVGNYRYMLNELKFICDIDLHKNVIFCRELGYLNEKVGNRKEAINHLKNYIKLEEDEENIFVAQLLLFEIEHHYDFDTTNLEYIRIRSKCSFTRSQAEYWIAHIDIEQGNFNYDEFYSLLETFESNKNYYNEANFRHILRRMYSDLSRVYYLKGEINKKRFQSLKKRMTESKLKVYHREFNIHFVQVTSAQYLQCDLLFQVGFYGGYKYNVEFPEKLNHNSSIDEIAKTASDVFSGCETAFKNNGNKAWKTIRVRRHEIELTIPSSNHLQIKEELNLFRKECIIDENSIHLSFVNAVLIKWYVINYYSKISEGDSFGETFQICVELLNEIRNICEKCKNDYGLFRANFMQIFLNLINSLDTRSVGLDLIESEFRTSLKKIQNESYNREYEMISYILNKKNVAVDLKQRFFTYYPIVLQ